MLHLKQCAENSVRLTYLTPKSNETDFTLSQGFKGLVTRWKKGGIHKSETVIKEKDIT